VVDVDLPDKHIVQRWAHLRWYDGPVWVTFEVRYNPASRATGYPIFRKRVPTRQPVRLLLDAEKQNRYIQRNDPRGSPFFDFNGHWSSIPAPAGDQPANGFSPSSFVTARWAELKADLFAKDVSKPEVVTDEFNPLDVEKQLEQRLESEVFADAKKKDELNKGLTEAGEKIREVVGCQWTTLRYIQLALPEAVDDQELFDLVLGDQAAWGGTSVMQRLKQPGIDKGKPLVVRTQLKDAAGNPVKDAAGKDTFRIECPLTQAMRAQTLKLQAKLAEVLARHQSGGHFRHPVVEGGLLRIALTARQMGIDLEKELKDVDVEVQPHWAVRQLNDQLAQLKKEAGR
jgi:hypothetical protein